MKLPISRILTPAASSLPISSSAPSSSSSLTAAQRDILILWHQVNASLSAYAKLIDAFGSATAALSASRSDWQSLNLHHRHLSRFDKRSLAEQATAATEEALNKGQYHILFKGEPEYPARLNQLYDPPPILFYRGNLLRLHEAQIAIVGTRKPTPQALKITFDLAQYLAQAGYVITSGLAMGVDRQAHLGALASAETSALAVDNDSYCGRTVGVMGTGIDVCYPKHHDDLFAQIIHQGGCLISELLPGTPPNKHTFPRRNRLVAGLSLATVVTEAAVKSGSLITARLTSEQGKQVFAIPSHIDNSNAEGCHHLIREGATLVYHPDQIIEDVQLQEGRSPRAATLVARQKQTKDLAKVSGTSNSQSASDQATNRAFDDLPKSAPTSQVDIPAHLTQLFAQLDWSGQDLDALIAATDLDTPSALSQLMELELLGVVTQQGGRYFRV